MKPIIAFVLLLLTADVWAAATISPPRINQLPDGTQIVFDLSDEVRYSSFLLANPARLVVDVDNARLASAKSRLAISSADFSSVRVGQQVNNALRLVFDLTKLVRGDAYLALTERKKPRLVIDIYRRQPPLPGSVRNPEAESARRAEVRSATPPRPPERRALVDEIVVALDPGHGGNDPGAVGPKGTKEKEVVLSIAKRLKKLIDRESGMRAVMTRDSDRYLRLPHRIRLAQQRGADIFISIHADAAVNRKAHGSSVYILSSGRASSEAARMLANQENAVDRLGSVRLLDDDDINTILVDMQQEATMEASMVLAGKVLKKLGKVGEVHKSQVERASFAVLTSPIMPSILVETAFISNVSEEKKLRSGRYQQQIAVAIMDGIRDYFEQRPPQPTLQIAEPSHPVLERMPELIAKPEPPAPVVRTVSTAPKTTPPLVRTVNAAPPPVQLTATPIPPPSAVRRQIHVIQRGESLAQIARQYRISLPLLRSVNGLRSNQLRMPAGTALKIPAQGS